ncbi:hypothetical protein BH11BAC5_BH11BAC5_23910 [soil metagenome]
MDEKAMGFNESQLKRTGFAEAFTPELKSQMERSVPEIQHSFKKEYEGDKVEAVLHLKKSLTSDYYFLNKFDLQLQKDGQAETVRQTFFLTRNISSDGNGGEQKQKVENKYTLKEAYNLLDGRPVFKKLVDSEGHEYQAWVKMNLQNTFPSGNHELKHYHTNYGFDLETVLAKYAIKELSHTQYKQSLMESLQRGNLQKATFVGASGKEEQLYITPVITLKALLVYDENKQRIPTDLLVEKNYIRHQQKEDLKQQQRPQQTVGQNETQAITAKQETNLKPKASQKQEQEAPKKKQSRKQKIN